MDALFCWAWQSSQANTRTSVQRIVLRISGAARGKARTRPRPGATGDASRFMKPKGDRIAEAVIIDAWKQQGEPRMEEDVAIRILVVIATPRPQGHYKKNGTLSIEGVRQPVPRKRKPDLDNALKLVFDALNKRAYRDDVLVAEVGAIRRWGEWDETLVVIEPIHEPIE